MTKKELLDKLNSLECSEDTECVLAINTSAGFPGDCINVWPIERVFENSIKDMNPPCKGYYNNTKYDRKIFLYVFP